MINLRYLGNDKSFIETLRKSNLGGGRAFGRKRDENLGVGNWGDKGLSEDVACGYPRFL